jgi:hypothetical protein
MAKWLDAGSPNMEVMSRSGRTADPESHSSTIFGLDSWRTLFKRLRQGVNREKVAPRHNGDAWCPTIENRECPLTKGWIVSEGDSVDCEPGPGTASRMQAVSISIADRLQIIPIPRNSQVRRINATASIEGVS